MQRVKRRAGKLTAGQQSALNRLGFIWDVNADHWQKHYTEFKRYSQSKRGKTTACLRRWMNTTRDHWDRLSARQQELLLRARFSRDPFGELRENNLRDLEAYYEKKGDLVGLPFRLRRFVNNMRRFQARGKLDSIFKERFDRLGGDWSIPSGPKLPPYPVRWKRRYAQVEAYVQQCSPHVPPFRKWEDQQLSHWVQVQKEQWKSLSRDQRRRLAKLNLKPGMARKLEWEKRDDRAVQLYLRLGPYRRAAYRRVDKTVGRWIRGQVERWAHLRPDEQKKMRALGIQKV